MPDLAKSDTIPSHPALKPALDAARQTLTSGDLADALARYADLRANYPEAIEPFAEAAAALSENWHFEEARALLEVAAERFPADAAIAVAIARNAADRGDPATAAALWQDVQARFPGDPAAVPDPIEPLIAEAEATVAHRDWPEAARLWAAVRDRFPARAAGYAGQARVWRALGQFDAAEAVLADAAGRFPDHPAILIGFAELAQARRDWPAALTRWADLRSRFPGHAPVFLGGIAALRDAGLASEAEALAIDAQRRFPSNPALAAAFAALADNQTASVRWDRVRARFPGSFGHTERPAAPIIPPPAILRVAVGGGRLAWQVSQLLRYIAPFRDRLDVRFIDTGKAPPADGWLDGAAIYFEESTAESGDTKAAIRAVLPRFCERRQFAAARLHALWPFLGRDKRRAPEPPFYRDGRYVDADGVAATLAGSDLDDDTLFDLYMTVTETAPLDLDAMFAADLDRLRAEDRDVTVAPFVAANIRDTMLFAAPTERCGAVVKEIVRQLLTTPALTEIASPEDAMAGLERLTQGWRAHAREWPVHPRVARHFGLTWWSPDRLYQLGRNSFSFRDYTIRYLRWSPWLV